MRLSSHPPQTALRPHPTRFIYLSLDGRAYSGLGWRRAAATAPLPSTQAGCLQSDTASGTRVRCSSLCDGFLNRLRNRHKAWRTGRYKASMLHGELGGIKRHCSIFLMNRHFTNSGINRPYAGLYSTVKRRYRRLAKKLVVITYCAR